jgi:hypothetical protein
MRFHTLKYALDVTEMTPKRRKRRENAVKIAKQVENNTAKQRRLNKYAKFMKKC